MSDSSLSFLFDREKPHARDLYTLKRIAEAISIKNSPFFPQITVEHGQIKVELTVMNREGGNPLVISFNDLFRRRLIDGEMHHLSDFEPADWTYRDGVARIYQAVLDALKHELDESFHFMGRRIFDPHNSEGSRLKEDLIEPECRRCGRGMGRFR